MNGETLRKIIFYGGALAIVGVKVYGVAAKKVPWWLAIVLGGIGVITEPERVGAATLEDAKLAGYL